MENLKTLKIPAQIHRELKVYVAKHPEENMSLFSGYAIVKELKDRGHVFTKTKAPLFNHVKISKEEIIAPKQKIILKTIS